MNPTETLRRLTSAEAGAFFLALFLNLAGLSWGLPARFHPDEKAGTVVHMIEGRTIVPDSFINPSLPLFTMVPVVVAQSIAAAMGVVDGIAADSLFACRLVSALVASLAVLALGRGPWRSESTGVWAPFALAVMPGVVNFSHFVTPESWLLLGTVLTVSLALSHADGKARGPAVGIALGLTVSCKYTAAALAVPVVLATALRPRESDRPPHRAWLLLLGFGAMLGVLALSGPGVRLASALGMRGDARLLSPESAASFVREAGLWVFGLSATAAVVAALTWRLGVVERLCTIAAFAILGFVIGTPGCLTAPLRFLSDVAFNAQTRFEYKGIAAPHDSWGAYAWLLTDTAGWPLCLAAAAGLVTTLKHVSRASRGAWIILASGLTPFVLVAASGHRAMRFLVPVLPCVAWLAGRGVTAFKESGPRRVVVALLSAAALTHALLMVRLFRVDSRLEVAAWLELQRNEGETWGLLSNFPGYGPPLADASASATLHALSREMAPAPVFSAAAVDLKAQGPDWLVVPEPYFERFLASPKAAPEKTAFFEDLLSDRSGYTLVRDFQQTGLWRPPNEFLDPRILVFRRAAEKP